MSGIIKIIIAMVTWGSLGIFVKNINLESFEIAFLRALVASILLGIILVAKLKKENKPISSLYKTDDIGDKKGLLVLILSGIAVGFNWVLLFQSYKYTTVSNATLGYYFAPVIVVFVSPIVLKEKFTAKRAISVIVAMIGLFLILNSQVDIPQGEFNHAKGILIAIGAASFYASIIMLNKYTKEYGDYERTFIQLFTAGVVLLPFIVYRNSLSIPDLKNFIFIIILGVVHTTFAYCLYFSAIKELKAQSAAFLGYIDPVSAIFFSVLFLKEPLSIWQVIGGSVILIAAFIAEKPSKKEEVI